MLRVHLFISGRVQMVAFRAILMRKAQQMKVNGWVRNLPMGKVEAVFEGEDQTVHALMDWCHDGPLLANVQKVEIKEEAYTGEFSEFEIRY